MVSITALTDALCQIVFFSSILQNVLILARVFATVDFNFSFEFVVKKIICKGKNYEFLLGFMPKITYICGDYLDFLNYEYKNQILISIQNFTTYCFF